MWLFAGISTAVVLLLSRRRTLQLRRKNWCGHVQFQPECLHTPGTVEELQALVKASSQCKVVGSAHSFNSLASTTGALISLARLDVGALQLDAATGIVWVPGALTYSQLVDSLEGTAWALHNMASLPHITVAGSIATATHGSGVGNGNLSSCVVGLELVCADGSLLRATPASHPLEFPGLVVGLGALGIVTRCALQLVPAFHLQQHCYEGLSLDSAVASFDDIMSAGYSVSLFTTWRQPAFEQVWRKCLCAPAPLGAAAAAAAAAAGGGLDAAEQGLGGLFPATWHGASLAAANLHPIPGVSSQPCTPQLGLPGHAHHRLPHFRAEFTPSAGEELQTEYFVARASAPQALLALAALRERIAPLLHICEVRCVAGDALWLSMASGRDSVALHFTWKQQWEGVRELLPAIEAALAPLDARPHWGKLCAAAPPGGGGMPWLASYGQGAAQWAALRARMDPSGKFLNEHLLATWGSRLGL